MAKPLKKLSVDFSNTESSGPREIPEDNYLLVIDNVEEKESSAGNPMLAFTHKVSEGPYKGAKIWDNVSLTPQALWRFRSMLECLGMTADKKLDIDLNALKGKTFLAQISHEVYQGKNKPRITEFLRKDTAPAASKSGGSSKTLKKGMKVSFDYEGTLFFGTIARLDGETAVVEVNMEDGAEEWELGITELTPA
jgi:hypothetical protein